MRGSARAILAGVAATAAVLAGCSAPKPPAEPTGRFVSAGRLERWDDRTVVFVLDTKTGKVCEAVLPGNAVDEKGFGKGLQNIHHCSTPLRLPGAKP